MGSTGVAFEVSNTLDDAIEIVELYRGVGLESDQPRERIEHVVKPQIDIVHDIDDPEQLLAYANNARNPPEARLLAAAKCQAAFEISTEERRLRPPIDMDRLRASTAGLGSRRWRDPWRFCSLLDAAGGVPREEPLPDLE
jgi:hypothetical protein